MKTIKIKYSLTIQPKSMNHSIHDCEETFISKVPDYADRAMIEKAVESEFHKWLQHRTNGRWEIVKDE